MFMDYNTAGGTSTPPNSNNPRAGEELAAPLQRPETEAANLRTQPEDHMADRDDFLKSELFARGWTPSIIRDFLGQPDETPHRRGGGHYCLYRKHRVYDAEARPDWREAVERRKKRETAPPKSIDLLLAIFAVNRSAKRHRDSAQTYYQKRKHGFAKKERMIKTELYALKDRGIAAAYAAGRIEASFRCADGLIEYRGEGYCFHSALHPQNVQIPEVGNAESFRVEAKPRGAKEPKLKDAVFTLKALPEVPENFMRLQPQWHKQETENRERKQREWAQRRRDPEICAMGGQVLDWCVSDFDE